MLLFLLSLTLVKKYKSTTMVDNCIEETDYKTEPDPVSAIISRHVDKT